MAPESPSAWIPLARAAPPVGAWVLMYLTTYAGMDRYRAGMYMGPDDWMSAANWMEPNALLADRDVSHWQLLPDPPADAPSA